MTRLYRCIECGYEWEHNGDDYPDTECPHCDSTNIVEVG